MKLGFRLAIWLIAIASVSLLMIAAIRALNLPPPDYTQARMQAFLAENANKPDRVVENKLGNIGKSGVILDYSEGTFPEGYLHLEYWADDQYVLWEGLEEAAEYPDEWRLVSSGENAWRWDGGGLGRYVKAERLQPRWFCVEAYLPT